MARSSLDDELSGPALLILLLASPLLLLLAVYISVFLAVVYQCYQGVAGVYYLFKIIQEAIKNRHITHPPSLLSH
jgi:membrane-anchored glycerophosphoryl diester phosphodiesterase (GDPDase)